VDDAGFTIGRLSAESGVNIETIRYYERIGLAPAPPRSSGGRRVYDREAIRRLGFIRRARELGFPLDDIRSLLGLEARPPSCADVYALTNRHLHDVRAKIDDLKRLEHQLSASAKACRRGHAPHCPLIDALSGEPG
jgi:MerR family transcriptional regulator, mercuric resistance operon regulatory protein